MLSLHERGTVPLLRFRQLVLYGMAEVFDLPKITTSHHITSHHIQSTIINDDVTKYLVSEYALFVSEMSDGFIAYIQLGSELEKNTTQSF